MNYQLNNENYCAPLMRACKKGDIETVKLLISKGAYVNFVDKHGQTPLFKSLYYGNTEIAELLRQHGAKE